MLCYKILSVLLCYPEQELLDSLADIRMAIAQESKETALLLEPLFIYYESQDLISLQENYVQTFDRTPTNSLHLFEHIHGEDRARGQAMVDLMNEYQSVGFELVSDELPDYLPLFLEFLTVCDKEKATELLGEAIDVINHIAEKLAGDNSVYAPVLQTLIALSPVEPKPLIVPPIRDMDEAMEKFGPNHEGLEPLLQTNMSYAANPCQPNSCSQCTDVERNVR